MRRSTHGPVLIAALLAWSLLPSAPGLDAGARVLGARAAEARAAEEAASPPEVAPAASVSVAAAPPAAPPTLGREWLYTVKPKDTARRIAARQGVDLRRLLAINALDTRRALRAGQRLHLSDRHIPPPAEGAHVVINIPDGLLYRYEGAQIKVYPVALGESRAKASAQASQASQASAEARRWRTPTGAFKVVEKRKSPAWNIPPSIQQEMRAAGKEVVTPFPPGPDNPLGTRWIGLSAWGYGIHGTNAPASIGGYTTHGCIRMHKAHVEELFDVLEKGASVRIVYQPAKLARDGDAVYLEVSRDVYGQISDMKAHVDRLIQEAGLVERVDPHHVARVVRGRWGIATRVDRAAPPPFAPPAPDAASRSVEAPQEKP